MNYFETSNQMATGPSMNNLNSNSNTSALHNSSAAGSASATDMSSPINMPSTTNNTSAMMNAVKPLNTGATSMDNAGNMNMAHMGGTNEMAEMYNMCAQTMQYMYTLGAMQQKVAMESMQKMYDMMRYSK